MSRRTEKVASLIQQDLGELMSALELPALTTISKVEVTDDLKHANIWITIFDKNREMESSVMETLSANLYEMQGELNKRFSMKFVPRIHFKVDQAEHYASHINELLKRVSEEAQDE